MELRHQTMTSSDALLEAAGRRLAAYLRALPIPEIRRHELALRTLRRLSGEQHLCPEAAQARAMEILFDTLERHVALPEVTPGPTLCRRHMRPEPMDRRPWVHFVQKHGTPLVILAAWFANSAWIDAVFLTLITLILHALDLAPRP
jgi:hypothetical protein